MDSMLLISVRTHYPALGNDTIRMRTMTKSDPSTSDSERSA